MQKCVSSYPAPSTSRGHAPCYTCRDAAAATDKRRERRHAHYIMHRQPVALYFGPVSDIVCKPDNASLLLYWTRLLIHSYYHRSHSSKSYWTCSTRRPPPRLASVVERHRRRGESRLCWAPEPEHLPPASLPTPDSCYSSTHISRRQWTSRRWRTTAFESAKSWSISRTRLCRSMSIGRRTVGCPRERW